MRCVLSILCLCGLVAHAQAGEPRSVSVSGTAEIMTEPDIAVLAFAVEARAQTVREARERVDATVNGVTRLMRNSAFRPSTSLPPR